MQVTQQGGSSDQSKWRVRRFTYDSLSRLLTANNPESGLIAYFYDNNGNLTQKVMPSPNQIGTATHTISFGYDALNRVTGKAYSWQNSQNGQLPQGIAAVRYRYDEQRKERFKTVELIVEEDDGEAPEGQEADGRVVQFRVPWSEVAVRHRVKEARGRWDPASRLWALRSDRVVA